VRHGIAGIKDVVAAITYTSSSSCSSLLLGQSLPILLHIAGSSSLIAADSTSQLKQYNYQTTNSHQFAVPFQPNFDYATEAVSHTRNLTFLKSYMDGPHFDLEAIWDEHTYFEFENRSVEWTMSTMVDEPYVNHVPTVCPHSPLIHFLFLGLLTHLIFVNL
jgi:carboxymethylenebutenolidase